MIYDSRVGFLDLKSLRLKDELDRENKNKLIAYMKPLMNNAKDRNTIDHDNYQFYFNKLLKLKDIKIQNDVLTKEKLILLKIMEGSQHQNYQKNIQGHHLFL